MVIPDVKSLKKDVLQEHHDSLYGGHLGFNKTLEKICRLFWWPGIYQDIKDHVLTCPACQVSNYRNWKPSGQTFDFQPALSPWEVVHVDFAGPFKNTSPGRHNRICIFTDSFTKLSVFVRCNTSLTSEGLAKLYIDNVWKVYGRPGQLVSDNEPIMCAEAYVHIHEILGTKLKHISAYNAKANGAAEVMVKQLKSMLRAYEVQGLKWWKVLSACERGYNDSVHSVTGFTPFYMNFGRHPYVDVGTFLNPLEESFVKEFIHSTQAELSKVHAKAQQLIIANHTRETAIRNANRSPTLVYNIGDLVYLETSRMRKSHTLAPLRSGPFKVLEVKARGNSLLLEGFTHPFNVELITPALSLRDGTNNHLVRFASSSDIPIANNDVHIIPDTAPVHSHMLTNSFPISNPNIGLTLDATSEGEDDGLTDWEDVTEEETEPEPLLRIVPCDGPRVGEDIVRVTPNVQVPHVVEHTHEQGTPHRISRVPSNIGRVPSQANSITRLPVVGPSPNALPLDNESLSQGGENANVGAPTSHQYQVTSSNDIWEVPSNVVTLDQLPGSIVRIVDRKGKSTNSSYLVCLLSEGSRCEIRYRQLFTIVGPLVLKRLLEEFEKSQK